MWLEVWQAAYDHLFDYIAAYMFLALAVMLFTGTPVALALGGVATLSAFAAIQLDFLDWPIFFQIVQRFWGGDGASGAVQNPVLVAVPCFIFMGTMLEKSGVAEDLLHILQVMMRRMPGGLAVSVALMGTILAATTGIIGASVVMITLLALPTMLARRYSPSLATGAIAASATLGILIPPSIMLVLMANLLAISVGSLFIGAVLPGLLLSGLYVLYIIAVCLINPGKAPPMAQGETGLVPSNRRHLGYFLAICGVAAGIAFIGSAVAADSDINWSLIALLTVFAAAAWIGKIEGDSLLGGVLRGFVPPIFLIIIVLGSIFTGLATPTEAAGVGAFGTILLAWINGTLSFAVLKNVVERTALTTAMIFFIYAGAIAFSTLFRNLYGEDLIIEFIEWLQLGPWPLLFMLLAMIFLMGFFFDFLEITLIILPVFAPIIKSLTPAFAAHLGLEATADAAGASANQTQVIIWFAILVAVNLQTSFLTPPFGFALFYMKGVAPKSVRMQDIYTGIIPFVMLQLIGLILIVYWPGIALWLPGQILN